MFNPILNNLRTLSRIIKCCEVHFFWRNLIAEYHVWLKHIDSYNNFTDIDNNTFP